MKVYRYFYLIIIGALLSPIIAMSQSELPPKLFIISPSPGEVIVGDEVDLEIRLPSDLTIVNPVENPIHVQGEGHLLIWIDSGPNYDREGSILLHESSKYRFKDVYSGLHTIHTEYVRNDGEAYIPRMQANVDFEVIGQAVLTLPTSDSLPISGPASDGGLFLPSSGANTAAVVILVAAVIAILWRMFKHSKKRKKK